LLKIYLFTPNLYLAPDVHFIQVDLTDPTAIKEACDAVKSKHGNPTVIVNNAGIANHQTILDLQDSRLERVVAVNQLAHYRITREFLPDIAAKNHGIFVTYASLAGYVVPAGLVDYCGSKAAAVAFHEGLTAELVHRYDAPAVRTILVNPNFAATKLAEGFVNKSKFISPTLHPETVVEAVFNQIVSGNSGVLALPKTHSWMAMTARSWPYWIQKGLAKQLAETMRPYNKMPHREEVDPEIYKLWLEGKIKPDDLTIEQYKDWLKEKVDQKQILEWVKEKEKQLESS
jgi:all-trans-retinol dehydrogenase (NAD+)